MAMRRRSTAGGKSTGAQPRKVVGLRHRTAPKARPPSSSAASEAKVERLTRERDEALERQTATAEILKVIASSPSNVQPVFDAIVNSGTRLFEPCAATITTLKDGLLSW